MSTWNSEKVYFEGDAYYQDVLDAMGRAEKSIEMETYIFSNDSTGERFEVALAAAASRGVAVRLLVDGIGASAWLEKRAKALQAKGVLVRVYHPVRLKSVLARFWSRSELDARLRGSWATHLNRRNHRKLVVIDEREAWVGSLNVSSVHSRQFSGANSWRDTGVRVSGKGIVDLRAALEFAWIRSHTPDGKRKWRETLFPLRKTRPPKSPLVRLNYTLSMRRRNYREFAQRIRNSRRRIWITNAYLAPSAPIVKVLARASARGVDVRILVPRKSDVFFMPWVATAHYAPLLEAGVRIFEYLPRFLHAKSVIIDDWLVVGTSNMNRRSLLKDFEVDIVLKRPESLAQLEEQYARDLEESEEIRTARGGLTALLGRMVIYFMKNWI